LREQLAISRAKGLLVLGDAEVPALDMVDEAFVLRVTLQDDIEVEAWHSSCSADPAADDPAYIAFTSGTEGKSKAILGRHGALTAFMPWTIEQFSLSSDDRFSMLSSLVHDPLQRDVFTPLCVGATICIPEEMDFQPGALADWIRRSAVTRANMTPSFAIFAMAGAGQHLLPALRNIFFAGEPLTPAHVDLVRRVAPNADLVNLYGATETCRALSWFPVRPEKARPDSSDGPYPVGRGIADVQLILLNEAGQQCAVGEIGQIGIRSHHLAAGYHDDSALTARKFIVNPAALDPGDRIYLTGDLGRYRADGDVLCLGRIDGQVKVRGFRIEPGEVESALNALNAVAESKVLGEPAPEGGSRLLAFCVPAHGSQLGDREIQQALAQTLPDYMIPSEIVVVERMPLTENGKIDARTLLALPRSKSTDRLLVQPENALENEILEIFQDIFSRVDISVEDDFFAMGGNSLSAMRVVVAINARYGVTLDLREFFTRNSVRVLADTVSRTRLLSAVTGQAKAKSMVI
jgi:amino acid adenylation domain-containing protein